MLCRTRKMTKGNLDCTSTLFNHHRSSPNLNRDPHPHLNCQILPHHRCTFSMVYCRVIVIRGHYFPSINTILHVVSPRAQQYQTPSRSSFLLLLSSQRLVLQLLLMIAWTSCEVLVLGFVSNPSGLSCLTPLPSTLLKRSPIFI